MKFLKENSIWVYLPLFIILLVRCSNSYDSIEAPQLVNGKDPKVSLFLDDIQSDSLKKTVLWLQGKSSRFFLHENRREIAISIRDRFRSIGYQNARIDSFFLSVNWSGMAYSTWQYNVVARLEGKSSPGKVFLIGAHYDSYSAPQNPFLFAPGADDNASGVAGIVEIARVLKKRGFVPKNSIEFVAFAAEEIGLKGSADYAVRAAANKVDIAAMLNLDMISYSPDTNPDTWMVNVMNYDNSADLQTQIVECGKRYTKLTFFNSNTNIKRGDSFSFYQQGFKAAFVISEFYSDPYYHTINDTADKYNYPFCREVVAVSCAFLLQENR